MPTSPMYVVLAKLTYCFTAPPFAGTTRVYMTLHRIKVQRHLKAVVFLY